MIDDLGDRVILIDGSLIPLPAGVLADVASPEIFVVLGEGDTALLRPRGRIVHDDLSGDAEPITACPEIDERATAQPPAPPTERRGTGRV